MCINKVFGSAITVVFFGVQFHRIRLRPPGSGSNSESESEDSEGSESEEEDESGRPDKVESTGPRRSKRTKDKK